jgi:mannose-6-phosphate isomerase-like protein (cupin superfamily)
VDIEAIKGGIITNVYHIDAARKVALHKHDKNDELFYCVAGSGFGVLEDREIELTVGKVFTVPAGTMHSLRTDRDLYVCSFLVPVIQE